MKILVTIFLGIITVILATQNSNAWWLSGAIFGIALLVSSFDSKPTSTSSKPKFDEKDPLGETLWDAFFNKKK